MMDLGRGGLPGGGVEFIAGGVAMMRGCRLRVGVGSTGVGTTGFEGRGVFALVRWVWRWFVRGVDDVRLDGDAVRLDVEFVRGVDGPPCSSHARSRAERSRCPCFTTSSSSRASSSWVSRKPTCLVDAISARAGRPMGNGLPENMFSFNETRLISSSGRRIEAENCSKASFCGRSCRF